MNKSYTVAVVGGACAGSEIAFGLAELGLKVIVIEQNPLPYGKIEDGLPRWHKKLQDRERGFIDTKLSHANVTFVPQTKLGRDVGIRELTEEWGLPMVIMANGAWRDRLMRVEGAEQADEDSLVYQNPFVHWFNHYEEPHYDGKQYQVPQGAIVIGGGLASIDVAKICQLETVKAALAERGLEADMVDMEHRGIAKVLDKMGVDYASLNIKPARLYYRKRVIDMPLVPLPDDAPPEKLMKAEAVREKLVRNGLNRYGFEVHALRSPIRFLLSGSKITGIVMGVNEFRDGRFVATGEEEVVPASLVISSIGSTPESLPEIPMDGELYQWDSRHTGAVTGLPGVYCVGNAITGRGNIKDSHNNAKRMGSLITGGLNQTEIDYESLFRSRREEARAHVAELFGYLNSMAPTTPQQNESIMTRVAQLQERCNYKGDYQSWRDEILAQR